MKGNFAVGGDGGGGHLPEPGKEFRPDTLVEFDLGEGRDETGGGGTGLTATEREASIRRKGGRREGKTHLVSVKRYSNNRDLMAERSS